MQASPPLLFVVGARPNFVKVAPILDAAAEHGLGVRLLHTGQHYDRALSEGFIERLGIQSPDHSLGVGSGTHAEQTAAVMIGIEGVLAGERFDAVVVPGDVNSTMGAALAAAKLGVPVVHVESGLRSGDWSMPEEINRVVTDRVADLLLCHCDEAIENLAAEGIAGERVALVGNTMIDSLFRLLDSADRGEVLARFELTAGEYVLVTLHRPALVDDSDRLAATLAALGEVAERLPVVLPLHPRTRARLDDDGLAIPAGVRLLEPLDYLDFTSLEAAARIVITDSGGVQEETSALGVPCLTYRTTTERPVTCRLGTNALVGLDPVALTAAAREEIERPSAQKAAPIPLWDGRAGGRAAQAIADFLERRRAAAHGP